MKLRKKLPEIKIYRRLRYRKGYGVHSPFVYSLITKVIEEKASFYAFDEIEAVRKEMINTYNPLSHLTIKETQHRNYGALLFRMVNFFKCNSVLQIGGSSGIMSLYLAMASPLNCRCYVLERRNGLLEKVKTFSNTHGLKHLHFLEGNYDESLRNLRADSIQPDLLFINDLSEYPDVEKAFSSCFPFMNKQAILIIDNIKKDKRKHELWQKIKNHSLSRVTLDLYALGIVFFDDKLPKKHYKTYFNYGKKQNLHKKWRRRLYFISRRKKSPKNKFSHRGLWHSG
jgi:predicted O-methyltransferase YrrM